MQRPTLPSMLLVLAIVGCSADSTSDPVTPEYGMVPTPFDVRCKVNATPPQFIAPGVARQINTGDCIVSHLGKTTYYSENIVNFTSGTQTIQATYTAANGDVLYATGAGTNQFVGPGLVAFQANVDFAGGTGRFADATGSVTISGQANVITREAQFTGSGTIAY